MKPLFLFLSRSIVVLTLTLGIVTLTSFHSADTPPSTIKVKKSTYLIKKQMYEVKIVFAKSNSKTTKIEELVFKNKKYQVKQELQYLAYELNEELPINDTNTDAFEVVNQADGIYYFIQGNKYFKELTFKEVTQ